MSKLVIKWNNLYIKENRDYETTTNINEAKNFKWMWLWTSRADILQGIKYRFLGDWEYVKIP